MSLDSRARGRNQILADPDPKGHTLTTDTPDPDSKPSGGTYHDPVSWPVPDLVAAIHDQTGALDELVTAGELAVLYGDDHAITRFRQALRGWREASGDPR